LTAPSPLSPSAGIFERLRQVQADPVAGLEELKASAEPQAAALYRMLSHPEAIVGQGEALAALLGPESFQALAATARGLHELAGEDGAVRALLSAGEPAAALEEFKKRFDGSGAAAALDASPVAAAPASVGKSALSGLARAESRYSDDFDPRPIVGSPVQYVSQDGKRFLQIQAGARVRRMELGSGGPRAPQVRFLRQDVLEISVGDKPFLVKLTQDSLNYLADMMEYLSDPDESLTNLMLRGDMGTGKNTLVYTLAGLLNQGVRIMSFHAHTNEKDLRYRTTLGEERAGETSRKHSEIYEGAEAGDWVIGDEPNKPLRIGILNSLNTILQNRRETLPGEERAVVADKRFRFIALVNPPNRSYTVQEMPADFIRRFSVLDIDYMKDTDEVDFVMDTVFLDEIEPKRAQLRPLIKQIVGLANDLRSSYRHDDLPRPMSTRGVLGMAWHVKKFPNDLPYFREIFDPVYPTEYMERSQVELVEEYLKQRNLQGQSRPADFNLPDVEIDETAGKVRLGNERWGVAELALGDLKAGEIPESYRDIPHLQGNLRLWWALMKDRAMGRHSLVLGETGTGKTQLTGHFLYALLRIRPEEQQFTPETRGQDIGGKPELKNDATYWPPYPLERAVRRDTVWRIDEVNKPEDPGTVSFLNNVLQFGQILLPSGKVLNAGKGFSVMAMGTPARAQYESQEFSGEVSDRFSTHILKPLPAPEEMGLVESYAKSHGLSVQRGVLEALQAALDSLRESYRSQGVLPAPPSVQALIRVVSRLGRFPDTKDDIVRTFLRAFPAWEKSQEEIIRKALEPVAAALELASTARGAAAGLSDAGSDSSSGLVSNPADVADEAAVGIAGRFVVIEPGEFQMGTTEGADGRRDDENSHAVKLTHRYEMQAAPVTQRQYASLMHKNPSKFKQYKHSDGDYVGFNGQEMNGEHPVENVTRLDAIEFANALSAAKGLKPAYIIDVKQRGVNGGIEVADVQINAPNGNIYETEGYRLATEAEWEYAARAGTKGPFWFDDDKFDEHTWNSMNSDGRTHAVGQAGHANAWGLYDMLGNVWEWVHDWYGAYPQGNATDPEGPAEGFRRILRGGGFHNFKFETFRAARRNNEGGDGFRDSGVGFRLVRTLP